MKGGSNGRRDGFTVLETLITLSVSGVLLVTGMIFISGKQNNTEFTQAIRAVQGDMQQIINEVGSGFYPNISGISCNVGGGGTIILTTVGGNTSGTNIDCVYLGRALHFRVDQSGSAVYNAFTVVAKNNETTLADADPRLIARGSTDPGSVPNEYETRKLRNGLKVSKMYYNEVEGNQIAAVAFVSRLAAVGSSDGSQRVDVLAIPNTALATPQVGIDQININLEAGIDPPLGVQICLESDGTDQSALLIIGVQSRPNSVELKVFEGPGCV